MEKHQHLHIVSFDIPWPANYGGVQDVFYKIKALHQLGIKLHLHLFQYGDREESSFLETFAYQTHYYRRDTSFLRLINYLPYIVKSRANLALFNRLLEDDYPILFEGIHTCYFLDHSFLKDRLKLVRCHNVEHDYYKQLMKVEPYLPKRLFLGSESIKLKAFESKLKHADHLLAISQSDAQYFKKVADTELVYGFHIDFEEDKHITPSAYPFILYHGNLSVGENIRVANYILDYLAEGSPLPIVFAGKDPEAKLAQRIQASKNARLIANPSDIEMIQLIQQAKLNLLISFQATGIKLKLLNVLYYGGFCIANTPMVKGTPFEPFLDIQDDPSSTLKRIRFYENKSFDASESNYQKRMEVLKSNFDNQKNAEIILKLLNKKV